MTTPAPRRRLPELDGLRAIAILLVLITHFWAYPAGTPRLNLLAGAGWTGVDLFFVLSGYLITGILWDSRRSAHYFRNFYARRVLRIFPLYYALLIAVFVLLPLHGSTPALAAAWSDRWWYFTYLANVALVLHGWQLFALDITWSLAIEEQFYLCWPLVIRRCRWVTIRRLLIAVIVGAPVLRTAALALGVSWRSTHMLTPFRLDTLALGALIALTEREEKITFERLRQLAPWGAGITGGVILGLILGGLFARASLLVGSVGYTLLALCFGSLLLLAIRPPILVGPVLRLTGLRRVGTVSYGIYILHPLCYLAGATALSRVGLSPDSLTSSPWLNGVAHFLIYSLLAYCAAEISYRVFETPLLDLRRHFEERVPARRVSEPEEPLALKA